MALHLQILARTFFSLFIYFVQWQYKYYTNVDFILKTGSCPYLVFQLT